LRLSIASDPVGDTLSGLSMMKDGSTPALWIARDRHASYATVASSRAR